MKLSRTTITFLFSMLLAAAASAYEAPKVTQTKPA